MLVRVIVAVFCLVMTFVGLLATAIGIAAVREPRESWRQRVATVMVGSVMTAIGVLVTGLFGRTTILMIRGNRNPSR